jgi:hypothetical protein
MKVVISIVPSTYEGKYPWKNGEHLLLLGKIKNMPGHVAVVHNGKIYYGFHKSSFRIAKKNEI